MHGFHSADTLHPLESFVHHINAEYGRSIEHGPLVDMGAVIQHGGDIAAYLSKTIFLHYYECHTGGTCILLGSAVNELVLADIYRTAEYV